MAIVVMMAAPQATKLVERYQLRGATSQIGFELARARMQAIAQNRSVRITFTEDGGYTVERSLDDGSFGAVVDSVDLPEGVTIEGDMESITFDREGMAAASIVLDIHRGGAKRTISMNTLGRIAES